MEPPSSHAFKRMKKEKVIEYALKIRDNLEGELSVALAERDQADEANQKLDDQKIIDQEQIKILQAEVSRLEKTDTREENKKLKEGIENIKQLIATAYGKADEKNEAKWEIEILKEKNAELNEKNEKLIDFIKNSHYSSQKFFDLYFSEDIVKRWMDDCCVEAENIKDGINEYAPGDFDNLYAQFKEWMDYEEVNHMPDKKTVKDLLILWQTNSRFGLSMGKKKIDQGINGFQAKPRFNLAVI